VLGLTRITFPGYTHDQLMQIIQSRLEGVPGDIVDSDAIQFASRKVAAVSGDARRALDICRRAVEIAENGDGNQDFSATPSKRQKERTSGFSGTSNVMGRVVIGTIKQAIAEATSSPLQQCLKTLPLASKVFLAALLAKIRRSGVLESNIGDVLEEAKRLSHLASDAVICDCLLNDFGLAKRKAPGTGISTVVSRLYGMGAGASELMEAGIISFESRKGERTGKLRLNIGEDEVKLAFKDDAEVRDLGFTA